MKKALLIFSGVIVFIIVALAVIPLFFKDQIKAKLDSEIAQSVDAEIKFKDYGLSFFRHFPNLTLSLDDISIVGTKEGFKGDTLFSAGSFRAAVDVMSVISGDQIKLKGIYLDKPYILTKFTKDGKMSWDIAKASPEDTTASKEPAKPSSFSIGIEEWKITDGTIIYDDRSMPMYTELRHVDHSGKGEMVGDVFSILDSKTTSPEFYLSYDNVTYLNKNSLEALVKFKMDLKNSVYTFIENEYTLNKFTMTFGGEIAMPTDDIKMDLKFGAKDTDFKNLLSLVPAIYTKDFENVKAEGKIGFDGWCKGIFNDNTMPGFGVNLVVNNGMFQYPNLSPVTNIAVDMKTACEDGNMNNMIVDLKKFHMDFGKNPVDAKAFVKGMGPMDVDAIVNATINLAEVNKIYPIEGTTLAGIYNIKLNAKGTYDDANKLMPTVDAVMSLTDGYVKSKDVPFPLEKINMHAVAKSDGTMPGSNFLLDHFKMTLDGEPLEMRAFVENFDNIKYDVGVKGGVDLTKLTKIYPLEGMTVAGRIDANINTKGVMSDVEAGKYDKTSTSGTMSVKDLVYSSTDMPQGLKLSSANFSLTPEKMTIENMDGFVGKSDINMKGFFANYMGYMFGNSGDTTIHGTLTLNSKKFDVNEWMTEEPAPANQPGPAEEPMTLFEVPKDVDFLFASNMNQVLYDSMTMNNLTGNIIMKNGIVKMDKLAFNSMGGSFLTNGTYNTQNIKDPKFDFDMNIKDLQMKEAYKSFSMVQKYGSIAKDMDGKFSTTMVVSGGLGQDMMPVYKTVNGSGKVLIADGELKDSKTFSSVAKLTGMKNMMPMKMKDVAVKFKIVNGNMEVEPFDVVAGGAKMNVSGKQSLEGNLDYLLKMDVPAGALGSAMNGALASLGGGSSGNNQNIKFDLKVTGPYNDPKVGLAGSSAKEQAKDAIENKVKDEIKNNAEVQKAQQQIDAEKKAAEQKLKDEQDRIQQQIDAEKKKAEDDAKKKAADELKKNIKIPKW